MKISKSKEIWLFCDQFEKAEAGDVGAEWGFQNITKGQDNISVFADFSRTACVNVFFETFMSFCQWRSHPLKAPQRSFDLAQNDRRRNAFPEWEILEKCDSSLFAREKSTIKEKHKSKQHSSPGNKFRNITFDFSRNNKTGRLMFYKADFELFFFTTEALRRLWSRDTSEWAWMFRLVATKTNLWWLF